MKLNETLSNIRVNGDNKLVLTDMIDEIGDNHVLTSVETPMRKGAFDLSDDEKIAEIAEHFRAIMDTLGLDLTEV